MSHFQAHYKKSFGQYLGISCQVQKAKIALFWAVNQFRSPRILSLQLFKNWHFLLPISQTDLQRRTEHKINKVLFIDTHVGYSTTKLKLPYFGLLAILKAISDRVAVWNSHVILERSLRGKFQENIFVFDTSFDTYNAN